MSYKGRRFSWASSHNAYGQRNDYKKDRQCNDYTSYREHKDDNNYGRKTDLNNYGGSNDDDRSLKSQRFPQGSTYNKYKSSNSYKSSSLHSKRETLALSNPKSECGAIGKPNILEINNEIPRDKYGEPGHIFRSSHGGTNDEWERRVIQNDGGGRRDGDSRGNFKSNADFRDRHVISDDRNFPEKKSFNDKSSFSDEMRQGGPSHSSQPTTAQVHPLSKRPQLEPPTSVAEESGEFKKSQLWYNDDLEEEEEWYNDMYEKSKLDQHSDNKSNEPLLFDKPSNISSEHKLSEFKKSPLWYNDDLEEEEEWYNNLYEKSKLDQHSDNKSNVPLLFDKPSNISSEHKLSGPHHCSQPTTAQVHPLNKRPQLEPPTTLDEKSGTLTSSPVEEGIRTLAEGPFAMVHPVNSVSKLEMNFRDIFSYNFSVGDFFIQCQGTRAQGAVIARMYGRLRNFVGFQSLEVLLGEVETKKRRVALSQIFQNVCTNLLDNCNVVKPKPSYFNDGGVPYFLTKGKDCDQNPPVYKILTKAKTGPLCATTCRHIVEEFLKEPYEDLFFHDSNYSAAEKEICTIVVREYINNKNGKLQSRKYGDKDNSYICVYKKRLGIDIFNEVKLKKRGCHPKYIICERSGPIKITKCKILKQNKLQKKDLQAKLQVVPLAWQTKEVVPFNKITAVKDKTHPRSHPLTAQSVPLEVVPPSKRTAVKDQTHRTKLSAENVELIPKSKKTPDEDKPQPLTAQFAPLGGRPFTDVDPQLQTTQVHPLASTPSIDVGHPTQGLQPPTAFQPHVGLQPQIDLDLLLRSIPRSRLIQAISGLLPPTAFQPNVVSQPHIPLMANMPFSHVGQPPQDTQPSTAIQPSQVPQSSNQGPLLGKRPYTAVKQPTQGLQSPNDLWAPLVKRSFTEGYQPSQNLRPIATLDDESGMQHEFSSDMKIEMGDSDSDTDFESDLYQESKLDQKYELNPYAKFNSDFAFSNKQMTSGTSQGTRSAKGSNMPFSEMPKRGCGKKLEFDRDFGLKQERQYNSLIKEGIRKFSEASFVLVVPVSEDSKTERDLRKVFLHNFIPNEDYTYRVEGTKESGSFTVFIYANWKGIRKCLISVGVGKSPKHAERRCLSYAVSLLRDNCNIVLPNPDYYNMGRVPDFLKLGMTCDQKLPLYKVVTKDMTGTLSHNLVKLILTTFKHEPYEDLFFHDSNYSPREQEICLEVVKSETLFYPNLEVRQYEENNITFICVYKKRRGIDIYEEVKGRNGHHPKYLIRDRPTITSYGMNRKHHKGGINVIF